MKNCCIWLVIYLNCTMMHGLTNLKFVVSVQSKFLLAEIPYTCCAVCLNIEEDSHPIILFFTGRSNASEGGRQSSGHAGVPLEHVSTR
jgi:hypothetical protein